MHLYIKMSEVKKNNFIILSYNSTQKKIESPHDFEVLENEFIINFNEDKKKSFNFYYLNEDKKIQLTINMNNTDFESALTHLTEKDNPILYIECKEKEKISISVKKSESEKEEKKIEGNNSSIEGSIVVSQREKDSVEDNNTIVGGTIVISQRVIEGKELSSSSLEIKESESLKEDNNEKNKENEDKESVKENDEKKMKMRRISKMKKIINSI